ncbi:surfeit locus protein 1 [Ceratina calcarata]|uniref:SURF1-like protein n=1 Tax=Ceratina calcarata TaxID=156304 RepID=A0AAJ7SCD2_9HYME|nr:surfeit locus protein 1 [Ceratina calcarata]XP_026674676.1 surfeit locus protein 1 [Ceratina calcarata]XP_026674677.1 surfeit locus protein 1 [Ceratina calcarata]XP_026674678.1 surfeit locus protein 1 [Ceratina calcarata]
MRSAINKLCAKLGNPLNVNVIKLLNKQRSSRSLSDLTNVQKPYKRNVDSYRGRMKEDMLNKKEGTGILEYSFLSIPIAAFALGTWQIQRLKWKLDLIEKLKTRINHEPIDLPENSDGLESKEYYPVRVRGTYLYDKEFIIGHRSLLIDGKPATGKQVPVASSEMKKGYNVITPFKLADRDLTILVNRGWIPRSLKSQAKRQESQQGEVEIVGILRPNERRPPFVPKNRPHSDIWNYRDVNAMAEKVNASPIYLELISNNNYDRYPIGGQTKVELRNEHFNYSLTWYCLSAATAYLWYRKFVKGVPFTS